MSERRSRANQVWEIPIRSGAGSIRVSLDWADQTLILIDLPSGSDNVVKLDAAAWRSLCGLRDKIRPARVKRATP